MHTSLAKKIFAVGSSVAMLLGALVPAMATAAVHSDGTNVSSNGTVYFIVGGQKRPYTSAGAFLSYGFNSWSGVVAASAEDLALPTGAFVPPADGSLINDKGTVYLISNGQREGFTSAANYLGLGYSWANVIPGDTSFMTTGALINTTAMAHPVGTLVNQSGTVYLMTAGGKMGIPSVSVFNSWGYSFGHVVAANSYDNAIGMNSGIMPARVAGQLSPAVNGTVNIPGSGVSASVASDNPAAGTLVTGQAQADLAHFTFSGSGTLQAVTLQRIGVSADTTLSNVYLFNGDTRLTDSGSVASNSTITFAGLNLAVNGSLTLSVKSDIAASTQGQTIGVALTGYTVGGSTATVSLSGNLMTIASATTADLQFGSPTSAGNVDPGVNINVWQATATITTRDVTLKRIAFRQMGTIQPADISNFRLMIDGAQVAQTQSLDANGYVTFSLNKLLKTGSPVFKVLADITGGSGRTYSMSLRSAADITAIDSQYNVALKSGDTFPITATSANINGGNITVAKATDSPTGNVTLNGSDAVLARYTFTAYGEPVKVETLTVDGTFDGSQGSTNDAAVTLRNGRILVNGSQVGSTTTLTTSGNGTAFTTNFIVNPGSPATVEVRADVYDNDGTGALDASDTLKITLYGGNLDNATAQNSLNAVDVPSANVDANQLTVKSGSLSLVKQANYADRSVVIPQSAYKIGSWDLTNDNTEDVNINTFTVTFTDDSADTFTYVDLADMYVMYGGTKTSVTSTPTSSNAFSVSFTLAKNNTTTVELYANILSGNINNNATLITDMAITATTASSAQSADVAEKVGQTITAKTAGSISAVIDGSTPAARIVSDNQTVDVSAFKFSALYDTYNVTDVKVLFDGDNNGTFGEATDTPASVTSVQLKDGSTVLQTRPVSAGAATFSGLSGVTVPAGGSKVLTVAVVVGTIDANVTSGNVLTTELSATAGDVKALGNASGSVNVTVGAGVDGNAMYSYAAVPVLSRLEASTVLTNGTLNLAKLTVASDGGSVAWDRLTFGVTGKLAGKTVGSDDTSTAAHTSAADGIYYIATAGDANDDAQAIAKTSLSVVDENGTTVGGTYTVVNTASGSTVKFVPTSEQLVSGTKTYTLKGTLLGSVAISATSDNLVVSLSRGDTQYRAQVAAGSVNAGANFIWSDTIGSTSATHSTATADWSNDWLVKNLPLDSWTMTP